MSEPVVRVSGSEPVAGTIFKLVLQYPPFHTFDTSSTSLKSLVYRMQGAKCVQEIVVRQIWKILSGFKVQLYVTKGFILNPPNSLELNTSVIWPIFRQYLRRKKFKFYQIFWFNFLISGTRGIYSDEKIGGNEDISSNTRQS